MLQQVGEQVLPLDVGKRRRKPKPAEPPPLPLPKTPEGIMLREAELDVERNTIGVEMADLEARAARVERESAVLRLLKLRMGGV